MSATCPHCKSENVICSECDPQEGEWRCLLYCYCHDCQKPFEIYLAPEVEFVQLKCPVCKRSLTPTTDYAFGIEDYEIEGDTMEVTGWCEWCKTSLRIKLKAVEISEA